MRLGQAVSLVLLPLIFGCSPTDKPAAVVEVPAKVSLMPSYKWVISADGLTLREGPGQAAARISGLAHGTKLQVLEVQEALQKIGGAEGQWIRVAGEGKEGWVFGAYLGDSPPAPISGTIRGSLAYPSEVLPAQTVVAFAESGQKTFSVQTQEGQKGYLMSLPPGKYSIVSYLGKDGRAAGYTKAVTGGLTADQKDHSLLIIELKAGATLEGIDPVDWYGGTYPAFPGK